MLADNVSRLLTAYVDGELDADQKQTALRLLQESPEARSYLRRLQDDSERLRRLPPPRLDRDLAPLVLQAIAERKLRPVAAGFSLRRAPRTVPLWVGWAVAAGVMLAIGSFSYFFFSGDQPAQVVIRPKPRPTVQEPPKNAPEQGVASSRPPAPVEKPAPEAPPASSNVAQKSPEKSADKPVDAPARPAEDSAVNAVPVANMEMFKATTVGVNIGVLKLADLAQEKNRAEARDLLAKTPRHRLELPCNDGTKAFERLQPVLKAHGIGLVIDQAAQVRLKNPRLKTNYVLYLEDLLPEELIAILDHVEREDTKAETRKAPGQFDSVVVTPLTTADHKELSSLLGVDPTAFQPMKPNTPLGVDPKKPVSDGTGSQVANSLAGQGTNPRAEAGKTAKPPEHWALVLPYNPVRPSKDSAEVKRFLASRKAPRPGTVQVLLVLRGTSS